MLSEARERLDNCIAIARVSSVRRAHRRTSTQALKEHTAIYNAIAERKAKLAERRMAAHIRKRRDGLLGRSHGAEQRTGMAARA